MRQTTIRPLVLAALTLAALTLAGGAAAPAFALGPVDVQVGAQWWKHDVETESGGLTEEQSGDDLGFHAELWISRWGLRATALGSDTDDGDVDYQHAEVAFKLFRVSEKNYLAVGAGLQRLAFDGSGVDDSTTGGRVSLEGHLGLVGMLSAYGTAAYVPDLGDLDLGGGDRYEDLSMRQLEVGLAFHPAPFLWIRGGYREFRLEGDAIFLEGTAELTTTSKGPFVGATIEF